jgi:predicted transcriptional regulator
VSYRALTLELPEDLLSALGTPEEAVAKARGALVFELLRQEQIGQSRAAELLGITREAVLDLMTHYGIDQGPRTVEELDDDIAQAEAAVHL